MPFLADKQAIKKEIDALAQQGYSVNYKPKSSSLNDVIDIVLNGQANGITIIYQDNSVIHNKGDYAVFMAYLNTRELNEFIQKSPKHIAPIIADALQTEPPEPIDKIHNYYQPKF